MDLGETHTNLILDKALTKLVPIDEGDVFWGFRGCFPCPIREI